MILNRIYCSNDELALAVSKRLRNEGYILEDNSTNVTSPLYIEYDVIHRTYRYASTEFHEIPAIVWLNQHPEYQPGELVQVSPDLRAKLDSKSGKPSKSSTAGELKLISTCIYSTICHGWEVSLDNGWSYTEDEIIPIYVQTRIAEVGEFVKIYEEDIIAKIVDKDERSRVAYNAPGGLVWLSVNDYYVLGRYRDDSQKIAD